MDTAGVVSMTIPGMADSSSAVDAAASLKVAESEPDTAVAEPISGTLTTAVMRTEAGLTETVTADCATPAMSATTCWMAVFSASPKSSTVPAAVKLNSTVGVDGSKDGAAELGGAEGEIVATDGSVPAGDGGNGQAGDGGNGAGEGDDGCGEGGGAGGAGVPAPSMIGSYTMEPAKRGKRKMKSCFEPCTSTRG